MIIPSVKRFLLLMMFLPAAACALKPPVQEMSDARSAVHMAQQLPTQPDARKQGKADAYLKSAESALDEAAEALRAERYDRARSKALEAKRKAQEAARIKQSHH